MENEMLKKKLWIKNEDDEYEEINCYYITDKYYVV